MSERDELSQFAKDIHTAAYEESAYAEVEEGAVAIAVNLAAKGYRKPRTITTVEELEQVKLPAIILDVNGLPMIFNYMYGPIGTKYLEYITGEDDHIYRPSDVAEWGLPATAICEDF